jgi:hypothetical protein
LHTAGAAQVSGHCTVPPQPLGAVPQITPAHATAGAWGVQHAPASQTRPAEQVPHWTVAPQASCTDPHTAPLFWQSCPSGRAVWHAPTSQTSPAGQLPHWSSPPQPSLAVPQV